MVNSVKSSTSIFGPIARRSVLSATLGGFVASAYAIASAGPVNASPFLTTVRLLAGADTMNIPIANGQVLETPRLLGGRLVVEGDTLQKGSRLVLLWDDRLYDPEKPVLMEGKRRVETRELDAPAVSSDGRTRQTIRIDEDLHPSREYSLRLGKGRANEYPHDIVTAPLATVIEVQAADSTAVTGAAPTPQPIQQSSVWGVLLGASWSPVSWGDGYYSWRPDFLTIRSAGPDPVPPGAILEIQLDSKLFKNPSLVDAAGKTMISTVDHADGLIKFSWALPADLKANQRTSLKVDVEILQRNNELRTFQAPLVAVRPAQASVGQRLTGQETLTRLDSATTKLAKESSPLERYSTSS